MPIRQLSPAVVAQIAAGEVIERPAAVVKELVENAIDAGARTVKIEIRGGGLDLIRVVDDGCGIPAAELELAFNRHATSKLVTVGDLFDVHTLGFRGEALASVAAVADVTVVSRPESQSAGGLIELRAGEVVGRGHRGCGVGTTVSVRNLFAGLPVRLKFLRSAKSETGQVAHLVTQYALSYPEVRFSIIAEGRPLFGSLGSGDRLEALARVYGTSTARALLSASSVDGPIVLNGWCSPPELTRASRAYVSFFVNRRWVRDRALAMAVDEAYRAIIPRGRYPIVALDLTIPAADLDVNVHPAKAELRFAGEAKIRELVRSAIQRALDDRQPVNLRAPRPMSPSGATQVRLPAPVAPPIQARRLSLAIAEPEPADYSVPVRGPQLPELRVIGQMGDTFIICEGIAGLYLVDQHRAHERVLHDRFAQ
ncbi:MAG: DNA mismatch repair endonuclease MutL, partial [Chloroflexi bacterium]|nr:DNA mismatch repair endonuclease MutL [Chloroflexota bacterium]